MSQYYKPKRIRNLYDPAGKKPFKLSRSKIELFMECPRCFYYDRRLGIGRPPGFPFNLNSAVDALLKNEFDSYRERAEPHPIMAEYGIEAIPAKHKDLDTWRENFKGIQFLHEPSNFIITGAIDDLWQNPEEEYLVVDYKSTSKNERITALNQGWQISYKRQMEIYQWLLRQNGYAVSKTGYFVYCNGDKSKTAFNKKLEFDVTLIPYEGNDGWVEDVIMDAHSCLQGDALPSSNAECDFCAYVDARTG